MSSTLRTGLAAASAVAALAVAAVIALGLGTPTNPARPVAPPPPVARAPEQLPSYRTPAQAPLPKPPEVEDPGTLVEATLAPTPGAVEKPPTGGAALPPVRPPAESPFKPVAPKAKSASPDTRIEVKQDEADRPPLEPGKVVYGDYRKQKIEGFNVYVSQTTFDECERAGGKPLDVLRQELADIVRVAPPNLLKPLRTIKIFVEWDHVEPAVPGAIAVFYGGRGEFLLLTGVLPQKAGHITVYSLKKITEAKDKLGDAKKQVFLLHELAHAVHYYALGMDNPFIQNAYDQAMARGLYKSVDDALGKKRRAYAASSEHEYFAEITCAYLDRCNYFPFDREDLRGYDTVGYALMRQVWGEPERLKAKKPKGKS